MTSILEKVLAGAVALLLAVGAGEWYLLHRAEKRAAEALVQLGATRTLLESEQARSEALSRSNEALQVAATTLNKQLARVRSDAALTRSQIDVALKANRTWADAPVPDAVWDGLFPRPQGADADHRTEGSTPGGATR